MGSKGNQTRELIKDAAYVLFAKKGFKEVTMKDICEATGLSRGGLYRYFGSTAEILEAKLKNQFVEEPEMIINLYTPQTAPDEVSISLFATGIETKAFLTKAEKVYGIQPLRPHVASTQI